jgi:ABC-type molybdate transport system permease subunit
MSQEILKFTMYHAMQAKVILVIHQLAVTIILKQLRQQNKEITDKIYSMPLLLDVFLITQLELMLSMVSLRR